MALFFKLENGKGLVNRFVFEDIVLNFWKKKTKKTRKSRIQTNKERHVTFTKKKERHVTRRDKRVWKF